MKGFFTQAQLWALLAALALPASSYGAMAVQTQNGVSYATGGIGVEERTEMKNSAQDYNLKLTLALRDGHMVGKTRVKIQNSQGATILNTTSNGPLFYARLQPGTYKVTVGGDAGHSKTQTVDLTGGQKALTFAWASESECCTIQAGDAPSVDWTAPEAH